MTDHMFKEVLFVGNAELDLWDRGNINITTTVYLGNDDSVEILEQIHNECKESIFDKFTGKLHNCEIKDSCLGHCPNNEIISYVKRQIWTEE